MFELGLSEEERLVQETARRFASDLLLPRLREHERARGVPPELAREFAGLGLDAAGGTGARRLRRALVLEELAAVDLGAALALDGVGLALPLLAEAGLEVGEPDRRGVAIEGRSAKRSWRAPVPAT